MNPAISLERVHFGYDGRMVLVDFELSVEKGQVLALLGPSGCGKTTVLRLILGLAVPASGVVRLGDTVASEGKRLRVPPEDRGLSVVFQDLALWPHLTVRGNLSFGLVAKGVSRRERQSRITALLGRLDLAGKAGSYPGELSGGERQRVAIARALVLDPRAVLLDEPLSNLDAGLKRELLLLFRSLFRESGCTAIYVTHDLREAVMLGDRIAVMESGRITQMGTFNELHERPSGAFVRGLVEDMEWREPPHA
ncbi:MAG: ABC transporter ATP-binding protein [Planctomycetota bacterium]